MVRDIVSYLDYSLCAEIALALFVIVFIAVAIRTAMYKRSDIDRMANLPLDDSRKEFS